MAARTGLCVDPGSGPPRAEEPEGCQHRERVAHAVLGMWSSGSPQPKASVLSIQVWGFPVCRGGPGPCWRPAQEFQEQGPETEQEEEGRGRPTEPAQQSPIFTSTSFYREHAWGRSRPLVAASCQRPPWPRFSVTHSLEFSSVSPPLIAVSSPLHTHSPLFQPLRIPESTLTLVSGK